MSYSPSSFNPQGTGSSVALITDYTNSSPSVAIAQGTPVYALPSTGQLSPVDVTSQASVQAMVGYANVRIPASASGPVISGGRLENITTSFSVGDAIYIGLGGTLINVKPNYGVDSFAAGDFVVFVGVLVANEFNPSNTDLQLATQLIGRL